MRCITSLRSLSSTYQTTPCMPGVTTLLSIMHCFLKRRNRRPRRLANDPSTNWLCIERRLITRSGIRVLVLARSAIYVIFCTHKYIVQTFTLPLLPQDFIEAALWSIIGLIGLYKGCYDWAYLWATSMWTERDAVESWPLAALLSYIGQ